MSRGKPSPVKLTITLPTAAPQNSLVIFGVACNAPVVQIDDGSGDIGGELIPKSGITGKSAGTSGLISETLSYWAFPVEEVGGATVFNFYLDLTSHQDYEFASIVAYVFPGAGSQNTIANIFVAGTRATNQANPTGVYTGVTLRGSPHSDSFYATVMESYANGGTLDYAWTLDIADEIGVFGHCVGNGDRTSLFQQVNPQGSLITSSVVISPF